ncbi:hypothetical protein EDB81DRAFT_642807, partial [Dactylonectria macrodidyma]
WNSKPNGGFSTGVHWIRVNGDYMLWNAEDQVTDPMSVFSHWRRVLELRRQHWAVFIYGKFDVMDHDHPSIFLL